MLVLQVLLILLLLQLLGVVMVVVLLGRVPAHLRVLVLLLITPLVLLLPIPSSRHRAATVAGRLSSAHSWRVTNAGHT